MREAVNFFCNEDYSFSEWLKQGRQELDALVFDIDGVLVIGRQAISGAGDFLSELRREMMPFTLLTNDANHSSEEKAERLLAAGLEVTPKEIVSAGHGLLEVVEVKHLQGEKFFIMGDLGRPCFAEQAGLKTTRDIAELDYCRGVIAGENNYDWETVINAVVNYFIGNPDSFLIAPNPDEYFPKGPGRIHIGAGGVARFIQRVLGSYGVLVEPIYLGKPHRPIFHLNHRRLEIAAGHAIQPCRVMMLGDFLASDILGANDFGYRSALVLTGVTSCDMLSGSKVLPELVFRSL